MFPPKIRDETFPRNSGGVTCNQDGYSTFGTSCWRVKRLEINMALQRWHAMISNKIAMVCNDFPLKSWNPASPHRVTKHSSRDVTRHCWNFSFGVFLAHVFGLCTSYIFLLLFAKFCWLILRHSAVGCGSSRSFSLHLDATFLHWITFWQADGTSWHRGCCGTRI